MLIYSRFSFYFQTNDTVLSHTVEKQTIAKLAEPLQHKSHDKAALGIDKTASDSIVENQIREHKELIRSSLQQVFI